MELEQVQAGMDSKGYLDFKAAVALVESQLGLRWQEIVSHTMGGGLAIVVDARTNGAGILTRATDDGTPSRLLATLADLASRDASQKGSPNPISISDYRGVKVYSTADAKFAFSSPWLVAVNNADLGKQILDRILDRSGDSLAADDRFLQATTTKSPSDLAWGYFEIKALREVSGNKGLFAERSENPAAEILFGGIASTLRQSPYVALAVSAKSQSLRISATAPHDPKWTGEEREYYFGPGGGGEAPPVLAVEGVIASVGAYRDLSMMWLRAADLLEEAASDGLAKADSNLSTLFSGKDFGEDILGALGTDWRLVVARQDFAENRPIPAVKLPAFAIVSTLKNSESTWPELRRTFQSLIGFFNVVGAMNGQPQLELSQDKSDAVELVCARPLADAAGDDHQRARINFNFSPCVACAEDRFVLASTVDLARSLATAQPVERRSSDGERTVNADAALHGATLRDILDDNRAQLVAQNMLEEGHSRQEAEQTIDALLEVVSWFDQLNIRVDTTPKELRVVLDVKLSESD